MRQLVVVRSRPAQAALREISSDETQQQNLRQQATV